jgi:hypothetical protein
MAAQRRGLAATSFSNLAIVIWQASGHLANPFAPIATDIPHVWFGAVTGSQEGSL